MIASNRRGDGSGLYRAYRIGATCLSLIFAVGITVYVFYYSFDQTSLFSWHPSFMTLGFVLLMAEAIMAISKDNIVVFLLPSLQNSTRRLHWILQGGAASCIIVGFTIIVVNKGDRPHFTSLHGIVGLIAVIFTFLTCIGGIFTLYSVKFKDWIKPSYNKLGHVLVGTLTFVLGVVAEGTGMNTRGFRKDEAAQITCIVLLSLASFVVFEGAARTAYMRLKRMCSH
ncbi:transmembrane reductase CYB561D2-like [Periplaneta americana]|uniref:transmembrane reductase CYB561D2-like n=1 Tax=Periplaneta americana TaxID=6978 RepID=UPI0037E79824